MSVANIKAALAEIEMEIVGVVRADPHAPDTINGTDMPLFCNFTGAARYDSSGSPSDADLPLRTYILRLFVRPYGHGIDGEAEAACEPFFERVPAKFSEYPRLKRNALEAVIVSDSGVKTLVYAGQAYIGIEFRLEVLE